MEAQEQESHSRDFNSARHNVALLKMEGRDLESKTGQQTEKKKHLLSPHSPVPRSLNNPYNGRVALSSQGFFWLGVGNAGGGVRFYAYLPCVSAGPRPPPILLFFKSGGKCATPDSRFNFEYTHSLHAYIFYWL